MIINPGTTTNTGKKTEDLQFYYHPDHLGSSSYITDVSGEVYQHMEYFPFGETFIEERNDAEYTHYLYNGKELDEETGLYYYGARYYDARTSLWASIDPLAEKYTPYSPFNYCVNNRLRMSDPSGEGPWDRVWGAAKVIGGAAEMLVGGALVITPEPTMLTKVGGVIAIAHGADNISTGLKQLWTGESQNTLTYQGTKAAAKASGASDATANTVATGVDMGAGFVSGIAGASKTIGSQLPKAMNAAKPETAGFKSLGAAAKGFSNLGSNAKKMGLDEIGEFLGKGANWHKTSAKSDFLKLFKTELRGSTNADFYIDKVTKEVLLKGNKTGSWVGTGLTFP